MADEQLPAHTARICERLGLLPLIERYKCKLRFLMHRIHNHRISVPLERLIVPYLNTRDFDEHSYIVHAALRMAGDCPLLVAAVNFGTYCLIRLFKNTTRAQHFKQLLKVYFCDWCSLVAWNMFALQFHSWGTYLLKFLNWSTLLSPFIRILFLYFYCTACSRIYLFPFFSSFL